MSDLKEKTTTSEFIISMKGIVKSFPGVVANDGIDFNAKPGEIKGLLGENGAGKTTLMKILYGIHQPAQGEIFICGNKIERLSPTNALNMGIGFIRQSIELIPDLTVLENILLGYNSRISFLNYRRRKQEIIDLADRYGLEIFPDMKVKDLDLAGKQKVEILKVLFRAIKVLILDEPTSSLSDIETEKMFKMFKQISCAGVTLIYITHKIEKALELTDRITVLRKGKVVSEIDLSKYQIQREELVDLMVGERISLGVLKEPKEEKEEKNIILKIEDLSSSSADERKVLNNISFDLFAGEILGIAGVSGNGQKELAEAIFGLRSISCGRLSILGERILKKSPKDMIDRGVFYVPADRENEGLLQNLSILFNANVEIHAKEPMADPNFLRSIGVKRPIIQNKQKMKEFAERIILVNNVEPPNPQIKIRNLSGGNAQKVLLGKILAHDPTLVIVANPTRGLDVKSQKYVHKRLLEIRSEGKGIMLISDDLDEIEELSDRIAVMYEGEIIDILPSSASRTVIGKRMMGMKGS